MDQLNDWVRDDISKEDQTLYGYSYFNNVIIQEVGDFELKPYLHRIGPGPKAAWARDLTVPIAFGSSICYPCFPPLKTVPYWIPSIKGL